MSGLRKQTPSRVPIAISVPSLTLVSYPARVSGRGFREGPTASSSRAFPGPEQTLLSEGAHASHAACSLFRNRQSSGSYGSFQPPSVPNNPSSGVVSILSCRLPLGMREPGLGWINRCAVIFTRQLPALIPLLQPRRHPLIDNTLKPQPAGQAARRPVGADTLARQA